MKREALGGILAGLAIIAGAGIFANTAVEALVASPEAAGADTAPAAVAPELMPSLPVRIQIPAIGVDTHIEHVGVNKQGNMRAPSKYADAAWYQDGTVPGQQGSAVIAGHLDNGLGFAGVFRRLSHIPVGADIYIETASSSRLHFIVEATSTYPYKSVPTDLIFNRADTERLNLITCDGAFLPLGRTYDHRLVVYATLAPNP